MMVLTWFYNLKNNSYNFKIKNMIVVLLKIEEVLQVQEIDKNLIR